MLGLGWVLSPMISIFYKRKKRETWTHRDTEEKAVCRGRQPLECTASSQGVPGAGGGEEGPPTEPLEGAQPSQHIGSRLWPPELRINFHCFKPPSLW